MGNLILLNDVSTVLDESNLIVGDSDVLPNDKGDKQSIEISKKIQPYLIGINSIVYSPAIRLSKMVHHIKTKSEHGKLANINSKKINALKERSFGVITGSQHSIESDLFSHTRICAEKGESIAQVRERVIPAIESLCEKNKKYLVVSHPFLCQILFNVLLKKNHTILTKFWMQKGSVCVFKFTRGKFGFNWEFQQAENLLETKKYSLNDILSEII